MAETSATLLERLNDRSDSVAWQPLVDLYTPLINAWLRRHGVSADDAEDLTQEVLEVVVREVARFRHNGRVGAFRTWLRTITINCLRQSLRSRRVQAQATGSPDITGDARSTGRPGKRPEPPLGSGPRRVRLATPAGSDRARLPSRPPGGRSGGRSSTERRPETVAAELGLTVNAVLIAKSRVLSHLRRNARGARRLILHVS